jgi:expansin (peptidoglycan-binding protein)
VTYGQKYEGGEFHLGPVDWEESEWHNACAPATTYPTAVRQAEGQLLAGIWNGVANHWHYCDACIYVTTARGKSATLRVVTYGDASPNSIDVSPAAYAILNSGEYPRNMSWQFAKCPDTGKIMYEFKNEAHDAWTAFWVRNARVPIARVEVRSASRTSFSALPRDPDGSIYAHDPGFGIGPFTLRVTGSDGQQLTDDFSWPSAGIGGQLLTGQGNFR